MQAFRRPTIVRFPLQGNNNEELLSACSNRLECRTHFIFECPQLQLTMSQLLRALKTADDKRKASRRIQPTNSIDADQLLDHDDKESTHSVQEGIAKECEFTPNSPQISHANDARPQQAKHATLKNRHWPLYSVITLGLLIVTFALWSRVHTSGTKSRTMADPALASIANAEDVPNLEALPVTQLRLDKNLESLHHDKSTERK